MDFIAVELGRFRTEAVYYYDHRYLIVFGKAAATDEVIFRPKVVVARRNVQAHDGCLIFALPYSSSFARV